ncbi:MAG: zf-HC2 domain-containing protein [Acidobacteriota bacterium]
MTPKLTCADVEIRLADYVDQNLQDREVSELKAHFATCQACTELAADAAEAVAFMERSAAVEPPPELVNKILFEIGNGPRRGMVKPTLGRRLFGNVFGKWLEPVLQPRFAMGMAMTMLSFGMLLRFEGVRELTAADLNPVNVWAVTEDKVVRLWDRGVKHYQSLKVVFEIQSRYQEWAAEQERAKQQAGEQSKQGDSQQGDNKQ